MPPSTSTQDFLSAVLGPRFAEKGFLELKVINKGEKTRCQFHYDLDQALEFVNKIGTNVYFGLVLRKESGDSETLVPRVSVAWTDLDYGTEGHEKANFYKTADEVRAALAAFGLPPSYVVNTGHGFHVYWLLREPVLVDDLNVLERINYGLGQILHGDSTHDASRVLRVPGTINAKLKDPPVPPVPCEIEEGHPELRYSLEDFEPYAKEPPPKAGAIDFGPVVPSPGLSGISMPPHIATLIRDGRKEGDTRYPSRSEADMAVVGYLVRAGLTNEQIKAIFWDEKNGICAKYLEKERGGDAYLGLTISKARAPKPAGAGSSSPIRCVVPSRPPITSFASPLSALMAGADRPIEYLAEGFLESRTIGFVGGEPKLGKSWLALDIGLCIASGTAIFDTYTVKKTRRVLYIQEEDSEEIVRRRVNLLCAGHDITVPDDDHFRVAIRKGFRIDDTAWYEILRKELDTFRPDLVVVDVLNKVHSADEKDQKQMTEMMWLFEYCRRDFDCGFMLVHHFKKQGQHGSKRGNQRLRGSTVLGGWSECSYYLSELEDKHLRVEHESKNPTLEPFSFRLEDVMDAGGVKVVAVRLTYQGIAKGITEAHKKNKMLETVTAAYAKGGQAACTVSLLSKLVGVGDTTTRKRLKLLVGNKMVRMVEVMVDGGTKAAAYIPTSATPSTVGSASAPPLKGGDLMSHPPEGDSAKDGGGKGGCSATPPCRGDELMSQGTGLPAVPPIQPDSGGSAEVGEGVGHES